MKKQHDKPAKTHKGGGKPEHQGSINLIVNELRTPLTVVSDALSLFSEMQAEGEETKKGQLLATIRKNVERIRVIVDGLAANEAPGEARGIGKFVHFDIMTQIQQVCSTHDTLFLQKQLHYHISASADLPRVYANPEQVLLVLSNLISNAIKYAPRGSDIEISVKEVNLRQGAGVEVTMINASEEFTERDRYHIFEKFYKGKAVEGARATGVGLSICREIVQHSQGQLWVDIPAKGKVAFAFVLPCAEIKGQTKVVTPHTFKYDITVANYDDIRSHYGLEKCQNLLLQVENYVRKLVRYPIDVVTAFEQSGIVSAIYETQEGNASSVAARISQKLGSEHFRIGKAEINLTFQYRLSTLQ
jgi:nitrogen-specific signal transduction histidine kinase